MIGLSFLQITLQTFEGVQIGNLEIYRANLMRLAGSAFTFLGLLLLPRVWNSIVVFVVALNGGVLLGSVLNAGLVLRQVEIRFAHLRRNITRMRQVAALIPFLEKFILSAEECSSVPRSYVPPAGITFKPLRTENSQTLLSRSSQRGVYMLLDGEFAPVHTVAAAQAFVERLR